MLNKLQKKLGKEMEKKNQDAKKIMVALDDCIEEAKKTQIGEFTKVNNSLFEVKVKFKSKYISKQEYCQLFGLQRYMMANPKYEEANLRKVIYSRPIKYGFIIECDRKIENFFDEFKRHDAYYIATSIENERSVLQDLQRKIP
ncbi:MAG: hypothetical protein IKA36_00370 [Clostridia bacterium]|nr:hypothetical protein [Clostridia bacterium]